MRWLAAAEKLLEAATPGKMQTKQQAEVDSITAKLRYIEQFPRSEKYISILKEDGEMDVATLRKREEIFTKIKSGKANPGGLKALARTIGAQPPAATPSGGSMEAGGTNPDGIEGDAFFASADHEDGAVDFGDDDGSAAAEAETSALVETALEKRKVKKSKKEKKKSEKKIAKKADEQD